MDLSKAKVILVDAGVRYWEDAKIKGVEDTDGTLTPHRIGDRWQPEVRLDDGQIIDWPQGMIASIHLKICDDGQYFLIDENNQQFAKWRGDYVPNGILSIGDQGYGDYIIFKVAADGKILGWKTPDLQADQREVN
jgi:hypothetical protein